MKEIFFTLFLSLGVLTFLLVMSRMGRLADLVINRGVGLGDIVLLIVYSSPPYLTFTLPMALLLSTIVTLGRLAAENEILALKASGVNLKSLLVPIASVAVVVTVIGLINTHVLLPKSSLLFRDTLINVIKKGITIEDKEGIFNDSLPGVVIYIDRVDTKSKQLQGILVSDDRDKDIKQMIAAESGVINLEPTSFDLNFVLKNGNLHRWEKESDTYRSVAFNDYTFSMNLEEVIPYHKELRKRFFEMDGNEVKKYLAVATAEQRYDILLEIYKKTSLPLSALAFMLLTLPLGVKRKVGGKFSGVVYSLILFVLYYVLIALTESAGRSLNIPPVFVSFLPDAILAAIGFGLLRTINGEDPWFGSRYVSYLVERYGQKA